MKKIRHKHDYTYGKTWAITPSGDIEFFKDRSCLDQRCNKYQLWFSKRWRDSIPGLSLDKNNDFLYESRGDDTVHAKEGKV